MESYLAELRSVSQAVLAVSGTLGTRDALAAIVRSARTLVDARYAALGVPDDRGSFAEFVTDGISRAMQRAIGPLPRQHGPEAEYIPAVLRKRLCRRHPRKATGLNE